jgi:excisionase family DNA binding protein
MSGPSPETMSPREPTSARIEPASEPAPAYLTLYEVAGLLRVSTRTVERWVRTDPTLPVLRLGGVVRFPRARLERWLARHEQGREGRQITHQSPTQGKAA